jgi:hypothetical protein
MNKLRLRYCPECGIVTVGRQNNYCRGIVMRHLHNPLMTKWLTLKRMSTQIVFEDD